MSGLHKKIAVLIPCFNEEKTVSKVVCEWKKVLPKADIYVYDNNSDDKTALFARESGAIVRKEYAQGKGNVIRRMFREIDADCYILVDGDDTYDAECGRKMVELVLAKSADMVIGDRISSTYLKENKRKYHVFGNNIVKKSINKLFKTNVEDVMTGCRALSRQFVKTFPVLSKGFEVETEMTIHAVEKNMRIETIAVGYKDRTEGSVSKLNTYSDGYKVLKTIIRLYKNYKPFAFFGMFSLALLIIALILFVPVLIMYLKTGLVERFPTLIVSGFIALAAVQSFFAGMILESLVEKERQNFEFKLVLENLLDKQKAESEENECCLL